MVKGKPGVPKLRKKRSKYREKKWLVVSNNTGVPIHSSDTKAGAVKWQRKHAKGYTRIQKNPHF